MLSDEDRRIKLKVYELKSPGRARVDVDRRLHQKEGNYRVYATTGYTPSEGESHHLRAMLATLMDCRSGVEEVIVQANWLVIEYSLAVTIADLHERVMEALREAGFEPVDIDEEERQLQEDLRSSCPKPWWRWLWPLRSRNV